MNRINQISKTLLKNLESNKNPNIEFILIDFGSSDGLQNFILNNKDFKKYLESKHLKYFYIKELNNWHASIAKNTAHMFSTGYYVVNLDCDNYIGENGGDFLLDIFKDKGKNTLVTQRDFMYGSGCAGRIALSKENFLKLGGYNEQFYPMGYQDCDLIERAKKLNLNVINFNENNNCIKNTKKESIKNTGINMSYEKMVLSNKFLSKINLENNIIKANIFKKYIGVNNHN